MTGPRDMKPWEVRLCSVPECDRPFYAKGHCNTHYAQVRRHGRLLTSEDYRSAEKRGCAVDGCTRRHHAHGFCQSHYGRYVNHGDPLGEGTPSYSTPNEAFLARTRWDGDCLAWTGAKVGGGRGYGVLSVDGVMQYAHRFSWERTNGAIPEGIYIDHMCHNQSCVNVAHLRLATPQENAQNKRGPIPGSRSGLRGVYWNERSGKWQARATVGGVVHFAGLYQTKELAGEAASELRSRIMPFSQG